MTRFRVLLADCPWKFGDKLPGKTRGAERQYPCMSTAELCAFQLPPLADDCLLMLWRMSSMQQDALDVMRAWGFRQHSEIVWCKLTKRDKAHFGMGRIVRGSHETCLLGVRGRFKPASRSVRSRFDAQCPVDTRGRVIHSAKPDRIYEIAEALSAGPYVELFARRRREGWMQFGNQLSEAA